LYKRLSLLNKTINNKYRILEKIGNGSFGAIYKGQNIRTNEEVAVKMEPIDAAMRMIKHEAIIYQYLLNTKGIPTIKWFGKDRENTHYYMVLTLLGDSLQTIKDRQPAGFRFSATDTAKIGIQLISLLKTVHEKGLIHRDIKPENFMFASNVASQSDKLSSQLYIIDFGFCRPYVEGTQHIPQKKNSALIGSQMYASINAHNCIELSRRDDMESIGYILLYFYLGELPWKRIDCDKTDVNARIIQMKRAIVPKSQNKQWIPSFLIDYFNSIRNLPFEARPDYDYLINLLDKL